MKAHLPSLLVLALSLFVAAAQDVGRFQISSSVMRLPNGDEETLLVKLDTATGRTWKYIYMQVPIAEKYDKTPILGTAAGWVDMTDLSESSVWKMSMDYSRSPKVTSEASRENVENIRHMVAWAKQHLLTGGTYVSPDGSTNKFTAENAAQILRTYK